MKGGLPTLLGASSTLTLAAYYSSLTTKQKEEIRVAPVQLAKAARMATMRPKKKQPCLHAHVNDAATGRLIHICGVSHVNPLSSKVATETFERLCNSAQGIALVALEADATMLALCSEARRTLHGLSREEIRSQGVEKVRDALFNSRTVHERAREENFALESASQIPLHPTLVHHMRSNGVLWGREQAEIANMATQLGVRLLCMDGGRGMSPYSEEEDNIRISFIQKACLSFTCWLRAQIILPGFDEEDCAIEHVEASNAALVKSDMITYVNLVDSRDRGMTRKIREACVSLDASGECGAVFTVVGARHVPGLVRRLGCASEIHAVEVSPPQNEKMRNLKQ